MRFCEDCGEALSPGVFFCENCGAKISDVSVIEDSFVGNARLKDVVDVELGIVYTNTDLLAAQMDIPQGTIISIIDQFVSDAKERGIRYEFYDVARLSVPVKTVVEHITFLLDLLQQKPFSYLFIIGSSSVIPSAVWNNEASDSECDSDVESDLPYATLDIQSPFSGQRYDFDNALYVGRLPNCDFMRYFENVRVGAGKLDEIHTFSMSAKVWEAETIDIYKKISRGPTVVTSPDCTKEKSKSVIPNQTNLFLFNLHGSNQTKYWYGQERRKYPEAIEPETFETVSAPYFLAVEACYGAYYQDRTAQDSILLSALNGKCISFLGASRIAFGSPSPKGTCADVICGEYLKALTEGLTAGAALSKARKILVEDKSPEAIKTLAEFSLYGDPSAEIKGNSSKIKSVGIKTSIFDKLKFRKHTPRKIQVVMPDVSCAIRREITVVDKKIANIVEDFVYRQYDDLVGVKPVYYKSFQTGDLNAVFTSNTLIGPKIVNVQFSTEGQIKRTMESK